MLLALSFPRYGHGAVAFVALVPLWVGLSGWRGRPDHVPGQTFRRGLILGLLTGAVHYAGTVYWTGATVRTFGGLPWPVAIITALLLVFYMSLSTGLAAGVTGRLVRAFGRVGLPLGAAAWVSAEYLRGWLFGGFPWIPLGNTMVTLLPIAQLASAGGVQNKNRIEGGSYEQLESQIIQYVESQEQQKEEQAFAARLREAALLEILLQAPDPPVFAIATDDQPSRGRADAPVTIVEFTDFECSSCAAAQAVLEKLAQEYGGKLRIVVRDYPLQQHAHASKAAEAAEAARRQGKYWEYSMVLYAEQADLGVEKLKEYASQLGLDRNEFDAALDSGRYADQVERDRQDGLKLGVNSTPTVFVNGKLARDRSYESLKAAIEGALKKDARDTAVAKARQ